MTDKTFGQIAFERHEWIRKRTELEHTRRVIPGDADLDLRTWNGLTNDEKYAWDESAAAVLEAEERRVGKRG